MQLKQEYNVVKELRGLLGFGWDCQNCIVTTDSEVWDAYIKVSMSFVDHCSSHAWLQNLSNNKLKTFRTKPFPLYNTIGDLIDGTQATGEGVFQAGQMSAFDCNISPTHNNSPSDTNIDPSLLEISTVCKTAKGKGHATNTQVSISINSCWLFYWHSIHLLPPNKKLGSMFYQSDDLYSSELYLASPKASPLPSLPPAKRKHSHTKSAGPSNSNAQRSRCVSTGWACPTYLNRWQILPSRSRRDAQLRP